MKLEVDYGFSCGRHWIKINGKVIAQTPGDDVWLRDEDIVKLGRAVIPGCAEHWQHPYESAGVVLAQGAKP